MNLLVTGATGNVGRAIISANSQNAVKIFAAVRNPQKISTDPFYKDTEPVAFDFASASTDPLPDNIDCIFLMRPPQISDPLAITKFLARFGEKKPHIIFLSIQGAEQKGYTPHRKIELLLQEQGFTYTFIRPSYFMDNITTTLHHEIKQNQRIYMPAGKLRFNWIDASDIGSLIVKVASQPQDYLNQALEVTGQEQLGFAEVVQIINRTCHTNMRYDSPWMPIYVLQMLRQGQKLPYILVMLLLHWLPKFQKEAPLTSTFERIMQRPPGTLEAFVRNVNFSNSL